jgi:hypothetical protein
MRTRIPGAAIARAADNGMANGDFKTTSFMTAELTEY